MALARLLWVAALLCLLIGRGASAAPAVPKTHPGGWQL